MVQQLVQGRRRRGQCGEFFQQRVAPGDGFPAKDRMAIGVEYGPGQQIAFFVAKRLLQLDREGVGQKLQHGFPGGEIDADVLPFGGRDLGDAPLHQGLAGGNQLDDGAAPVFQIMFDGPYQRRAFHGGQQVPEKPLLCALEGGHGGGFGVAVAGFPALRDSRGPQGRFEIVVDHAERVGPGVIDPPLGAGEGMLQQFHLHAVVGQRPGLVQPQRF